MWRRCGGGVEVLHWRSGGVEEVRRRSLTWSEMVGGMGGPADALLWLWACMLRNLWIWCMDLVHGSGARIWCMDLVQGSGARIWCMDLVQGSGARIWCMDLVHGSGAWIWCMDLVQGSGAWIWSMDLVHESGARIWWMLRHLTIWLAVMPPLKAWRQLSRVITATQRLGNRYITWWVR